VSAINMKASCDIGEITKNAFEILRPVGVCTVYLFFWARKFIMSKESTTVKVYDASEREIVKDVIQLVSYITRYCSSVGAGIEQSV
jgi:hypothetical protein